MADELKDVLEELLRDGGGIYDFDSAIERHRERIIEAAKQETEKAVLSLLPRILNNLEMLRDIVEIRTGKIDPDVSDLVNKIQSHMASY